MPFSFLMTEYLRRQEELDKQNGTHVVDRTMKVAGIIASILLICLLVWKVFVF